MVLWNSQHRARHSELDRAVFQLPPCVHLCAHVLRNPLHLSAAPGVRGISPEHICAHTVHDVP